ncbi:GATA-type zinc finger protein 1 [Sorex fumeus]|uniref:GATA-type zinc finger protein 1 n=1 Tax=Sorex fumeus TaxID=62283 RepID=UPI0024ADD5FF|nr:GATA-type zinc finger protein 1 [Sorex fumeus]
MEAQPGPDFAMLRDPQASPCLGPDSRPEPPAQPIPRTPGRLGLSGRSWPACEDAVAALCFLHEAAEELCGTTPTLGSCWEPLQALGTLGSPPVTGGARSMLTAKCQQSHRCHLGFPGALAPASPRPRKQPHPQKGLELEDPQFQGVTLKFEIKPDASLHIVPRYSLAFSSGSSSQSPPEEAPKSPEASLGGSEALEPRRCASCRTQRTPLWRDAEDGTPLCNACGIRYKKYGTRCASCWLVPRKNVQPKRLCSRCGTALGSPTDPAQED